MFNELGTLLAWDEYTGGSGINRNVQKFRALDRKVSVILGNETGVKFAPTNVHASPRASSVYSEP